MKKIPIRWPLLAVMAMLLFLVPGSTEAVIDGITGTTFNLTAKSGHISTGEGNSVFTWGYSDDGGLGIMQYPGPTIIVNQNDSITVNLTNQLPMPVSIVFPGQDVTATGGVPGLLTREAPPGGTVQYTFTASNPGTFTYYSGTRPELQIEMGLIGALIVRPTMGANYAYNDAATQFDHEYLFLHTQMDPRVHQYVEFGMMDKIDNTTYFPVYWFYNGRNAPDTLFPDGVPWLPSQPYGCLPRLRSGETILMRVIGGTQSLHPFHPHGNNHIAIARDGKLLESNPGVSGPDLGLNDFTLTVVPGETVDALFTWTGEKLGFDIYGDPADPNFAHSCVDTTPADGFDDTTNEYCADHGKPLPVVLPNLKDMTFGGFYSGSPFLGAFAALPPGEGGLNLNGGLFFPWHSHTEKELTNNDIFLGGALTFVIVEPYNVSIP
jgi:FtsP/CotA-like multicopper oxidase with cupredoxin domain